MGLFKPGRDSRPKTENWTRPREASQIKLEIGLTPSGLGLKIRVRPRQHTVVFASPELRLHSYQHVARRTGRR